MARQAGLALRGAGWLSEACPGFLRPGPAQPLHSLPYPLTSQEWPKVARRAWEASPPPPPACFSFSPPEPQCPDFYLQL